MPAESPCSLFVGNLCPAYGPTTCQTCQWDVLDHVNHHGAKELEEPAEEVA